MAEASADGSDETEAYGGLFGAIPYAFRASRSRVFRLYAVVGVLAAVLVTVFMALALVRLFGATATARGGSLTLSRAFYVVVALFVVGPLLAPVLLVARRHRRTGSEKRYDVWLGLAGFVFLGALYVGLVIAVPPAQQTQPEPFTIAFGGGEIVGVSFPHLQTTIDLLVPVIEFLYALPRTAGLIPPLVAAALIWVVHRLQRKKTN